MFFSGIPDTNFEPTFAKPGQSSKDNDAAINLTGVFKKLKRSKAALRNLYLDASRIAALNTKVLPNQRQLVRNIHLEVNLESSPALEPEKKDAVSQAVSQLFERLACWEYDPNSGHRSLEIGADPPGDVHKSVHAFIDWKKRVSFPNKTPEQPPSAETVASQLSPIRLNLELRLSAVHGVTNFIAGPSYRRQLAPASMWHLWQSLPRLERIHLEPGWIWIREHRLQFENGEENI